MSENSCTSNEEMRSMLTRFLYTLAFSIVPAIALYYRAWRMSDGVFHTVTELICIIIAISAFLVVWNSYGRSDNNSIMLAYGLLAAAMFDLLHLHFHPSLGIVSDRYQGLYLCFAISGRLVEAAVLLAVAKNFFRIRVHKWLGLMMTIAFILLVAFIYIVIAVLMPARLTSQAAQVLMLMGYFFNLLVIMTALYFFSKRINEKDVINYKYLFIALIAAALVECCYLFHRGAYSFTCIYAHLIKVIGYYYVYKGVFVSVIRYPYEVLEEANRKIEFILNGLPIGLITCDEAGKASFVNDAAAEYMCTSKEAICEFNLSEVKALQTHEAHIMMERCLAEACTGKEFNFVKSFSDKNGNSKKISVCVQPLEKGTLVLFRDAKKEQDLDNIQLQTRAILDAIDQPMVLLDRHRKTSLINKCMEEILEIKASEYVNTDILNFYKLFKIVDINKVKKYTNAGLQYTEYEINLETPKGKQIEALAKACPILDVDQEIIGWIGVGMDISKLKEQQQRMQQQEKLALIGQMAAGIVHEIKNPLATIKGFNQMIKIKVQDEKIQRYSQTVENAINDVSKVANEFLNFAKPKQTIVSEILINTLLESMQLMICSHTFTKGIKTSFVFSERERPVIADENQIKQVILNMCENAVDALADVNDPALNITTLYDTAACEMLIKIADNGKGMTQEVMNRLGTPFFTTKEKGTGLGVSVCYQIINKHNGRIALTSELGKGTCFTIALPSVPEAQGCLS